MVGHNICFKGVIWKIIPKLSLFTPSYPELYHKMAELYGSIPKHLQMYQTECSITIKEDQMIVLELEF